MRWAGWVVIAGLVGALPQTALGQGAPAQGELEESPARMEPAGEETAVTLRFGLIVSDVPAPSNQTDTWPGALIREVRAGSPAARAGLEEGMVAIELGPARIENARELVAALYRALPGQTLVLRLRAPGSEATLFRSLVVPQ